MPKKIILILLLALGLRLVSANQSFWHDEAISTMAAKSNSYLGLITDFSKVDNHPPVYYLTLKAWGDTFGYSEVPARLLSVLFGLGTIYFAWLISKKNNLVALLLAVAPLHIYYSQEVRMYAMVAFFASGAVYYYIKKNWRAFSLFLTLMMFTDYMPVFLLPVFWVHGLLKKQNKKWWRALMLAHLPLLILGIFWLPIFLEQVHGDSALLRDLPNWSAVAGGATLKQAGTLWAKFVLGRISLINKQLYYLLVAIASIPVAVALKNARNKLYWLWLVVPLALSFLASFVFPAFIYFRFIFVLPAFYLLMTEGASKGLIFVILAFSLSGWGIYASDPRQQREDWRGATAFVEERLAQNEAAVFDYVNIPAGYEWYAKNTSNVVYVTPKDNLSQTLSDKSGIYYFEYLSGITDPDGKVLSEIESAGFKKQEVFDFNGVGNVTYYLR